MKIMIRQLILLSILSIFIYACKDDYLTEHNSATVIESPIYVSPGQEVTTYPVVYLPAGNATFTITDAPEWLKLESAKGQFVNGVAQISCSAVQNDDFANVGIYNASLVLEIDKVGTCVTRVGYIVDGNPNIICPEQGLALGRYGNMASFPISTDNGGILIWSIESYPEWLTLSSYNGIIYDMSHYGSESSVTVSLNPEFPLMSDSVGKIILVSNARNTPQCVIEVYYNAGNPQFSTYTDNIDFGRAESQKEFSFSSYGDGVLMWKVEKCPEWITMSKTKGELSYSSEYITLTCNRSAMTSGNHTEIITIQTNDKNKPTFQLTVRCRVGTENSANVTAIDGIVRDAEYSKTSDILYMVTQAPNKLIAYDTRSKRIINDIALSKAPTCISVADDGQFAAVGHGGEVSYIGLKNNTVIIFNVNFIVFDIVLNNNMWCCLTPYEGQWVDLKWLNAATGEIYINPDYSSRSIYEKTVIRKKDENTIIAGDYWDTSIIDVNAKKLGHEFSISTNYNGLFWLSLDKSLLFSNAAAVYRTPSNTTTSELQPIGHLKDPVNPNIYGKNIQWLDHCVATNSLWVIEKNGPWNESPIEINQYEATDYTVVKKYFYDDCYTTINGVTDVYATKPYYLFANNAGTEVFVIKNVADSYQANAWSLERIVVQ